MVSVQQASVQELETETVYKVFLIVKVISVSVSKVWVMVMDNKS